MNQRMCKIIVDIIMTVLLLLLMARQITGNSAHEWLGAGMFIVWIVHHILNHSWYSHLFTGKYTPMRVLQMFVNSAVFFSMLGLMVSGIMLSREVFGFLSVSKGLALARELHVFSAFWGFVLMALHLGLHWNMVLTRMHKVAGSIFSKKFRVILRIVAVLIAGYGLYAFLKNQLLSYMFLTSSFVFFDFERPVLFFFTEYLSIMGLFIFLAYYISKGIRNLTGKKVARQ